MLTTKMATKHSLNQETLWTCCRCGDSGMTVHQGNCPSVSTRGHLCGHPRCLLCAIYVVPITGKVQESLREQQESGRLYTPTEDAALLSAPAEPQHTASGKGTTATRSAYYNILHSPTNPTNPTNHPNHAAAYPYPYLQAGDDMLPTFPFSDTPQQSLISADLNDIWDPTIIDPHISPHVNDLNSLVLPSFDTSCQEATVGSLAADRGYTPASACNLHPGRDGLENRLLSLHPLKRQPDPDSESETSSTSSNASTPAAYNDKPKSSGKHSRTNDQKDTASDAKTRVKRPRTLSEHDLPSSGQETQGLACPFWKKDPVKYRKCLQHKGYRRIRDVKQHLRRKHMLPPQCLRCGKMIGEDQMAKHLQSSKPCQQREVKQHDGITPKQRNLLAKHTARNGGVVAQWNSIWDVVFPDDAKKRPGNPFVYTDQSEDLSSFLTFLQYQGRTLLSQTNATRAIVDDIIHAFDEIHGLWRAQRGLSNQCAEALSRSTPGDSEVFNDAYTFESPVDMAISPDNLTTGYELNMATNFMAGMSSMFDDGVEHIQMMTLDSTPRPTQESISSKTT